MDAQPPKARRPLVLASIVAVLGALGLVAVLSPDTLARLVRPTPGGDFTLPSHAGPVSLRNFRGRVVLLYFGYTFCPDVCPTTLSDLSVALRSLTPAEAARVQVIFVSVDPERDPPATLATYAAAFHPSFVAVTGSPAELAVLAQRYGAYFAKQTVDSAAGYLIDHTASTFVIGPDGVLLEKLAYATPPAEIAARLRALLSEPWSPP